MAQINPKITIRSVYFGMLLLSAAVMIFSVRLTIASDLDSLKAATEQGDAKAVQSIRRIAEQGFAEAQFTLGDMYDTGRGVRHSNIEAVRWYRMAAEQGFAEAMRWVRESAEQGNVKAQFTLGDMYRTGRGIPKNFIQAYAWYNIAAAQGEEMAKEELKYILPVMATADITKAQELSSEYWEAYGPYRASSE